MAHEGKKVAVGVSGGGRSLENFLKRPSPDFQIVGVIASRPDCRGAQIAKDAGLPLFVGDFSSKAQETTARELYQWLDRHHVEWIALAGFLKIFPVRQDWSRRVVNIHPALLPKYGGKGMYGDHVHAAVLKNGDQRSGATVHFVDDRYDEGQVIAQVEVDVEAGDTVDSLAARVFQAECVLYPDTLSKIVRGELPLSSGQIARSRHDAR